MVPGMQPAALSPVPAYVVTHPAHLVARIGAAEDVVLPLHSAPTAGALREGVQQVFEPRRGATYWVRSAHLREVAPGGRS